MLAQNNQTLSTKPVSMPPTMPLNLDHSKGPVIRAFEPLAPKPAYVQKTGRSRLPSVFATWRTRVG